MSLTTQQQDFSARLNAALEKASIKPSPTSLARAFNACTTESPVTVHAVRKWLVGEAIPTQAKLLTLAGITGADPYWLRYGGDMPELKLVEMNAEAREVASAVMKLQPTQRRAVLAMIKTIPGAV